MTLGCEGGRVQCFGGLARINTYAFDITIGRPGTLVSVPRYKYHLREYGAYTYFGL